ncbi:hypothetical protein HDU92_008571 [Lobulomyces angularis]|nr:hypothetical protein HDU92_008571 [Lobulomyces angularis]
MASSCTILPESSLCSSNFVGTPVFTDIFTNELNGKFTDSANYFGLEKTLNRFKTNFGCTGADLENSIKYRRYYATLQCAVWVQDAVKAGCSGTPGIITEYSLCPDRCDAGVEFTEKTLNNNTLCPPSSDPAITAAKTKFLNDQRNYCEASKVFLLREGTITCGFAEIHEEVYCGFTSKEIGASECNTNVNLLDLPCCKRFFKEFPTLKVNTTGGDLTTTTLSATISNSADIDATPRSSITLGIIEISGIVIALIFFVIALVLCLITKSKKKKVNELKSQTNIPFTQRENVRESCVVDSNNNSSSENYRQTPPQNPSPASPFVDSINSNHYAQNLNYLLNYERQIHQRLSQQSQQQPYQQYEHSTYKEPLHRDAFFSETATISTVAANTNVSEVSISSPVIKPEDLGCGITNFSAQTSSTHTPSLSNSTITTQQQKLLVIMDYLPTQYDELTLKKGAILTFVSGFDDGWAVGIDTATGLQGVFPLVCVKKIEEPTIFLPVVCSNNATKNNESPVTSNPYLQEPPDYLTICKRKSSKEY